MKSESKEFLDCMINTLTEQVRELETQVNGLLELKQDVDEHLKKRKASESDFGLSLGGGRYRKPFTEMSTSELKSYVLHG